MTPDQIVFFGVAAMPTIVGVVQVLKTAGLPAKFSGLVALVLGVIAGGVAGITTDTQMASAITQGLLAGLGASGAWSIGSTVGSAAPPESPKRKRGRR